MAKIHRAVQALNEADVALFLVDARGLFTNPDFDASRSERVRYELGEKSALDAMTLQTQGMIFWGQETGGRAFYNTNDLEGAIRKSLEDSDIAYTLGYYPTHGRWDGQYRTIQVRVNRPGAEVRYRHGYLATADELADKKDRMTQLREAAVNPLEATAVGLSVRLTPFSGGGRQKIELDVSPQVSDLAFQQANGRWTGLIDILADQYSSQGKPVGGITKTVSENLANTTYQEMMTKGLTITFYESVAKHAATIRVVVRDGLSGALGSVTIPLHNPL